MDNEVYEYEEVQPQYSTRKVRTPFNLGENRSYSMNYRARNNIQDLSSDGGLRKSSREQARQTLRKNNSYSRKSQRYEYGSKIREKRNYVYYVSGIGYVTDDEQRKPLMRQKIIQVPKPVEKPKPIERTNKKSILRTVPKKEEDSFIQVKRVIDNYQYHETKNVKKEKVKSNVFHQRLSKPFEYMEQIRSKKNTPYSTLQHVEYNDDENVESYDLSYNRNNKINSLKANPSYQGSSYKRTKYVVQSKKTQTPRNIVKNQYQIENVIQPRNIGYNEEIYETKEYGFVPKYENKYNSNNKERSEKYYKKENYIYKNNNNDRLQYIRYGQNQGIDGEDEVNYRFGETRNYNRGNNRGYKYQNYTENKNNPRGFFNEKNYRSYRRIDNLKKGNRGQFEEIRELICPVHGTKVLIKTVGEY